MMKWDDVEGVCVCMREGERPSRRVVVFYGCGGRKHRESHADRRNDVKRIWCR